jgi:hypothetical protein
VARAVSVGRVLTAEDVREIALSLPEATEHDHHGRPSFRVRNRIFATLWSPTALNVMAGEGRILAAVDQAPDVCSPVHWGEKLSAVQVDLRAAEPQLMEALLHAAWSGKAPRRLLPP